MVVERTARRAREPVGGENGGSAGSDGSGRWIGEALRRDFAHGNAAGTRRPGEADARFADVMQAGLKQAGPQRNQKHPCGVAAHQRGQDLRVAATIVPHSSRPAGASRSHEYFRSTGSAAFAEERCCRRLYSPAGGGAAGHALASVNRARSVEWCNEIHGNVNEGRCGRPSPRRLPRAARRRGGAAAAIGRGRRRVLSGRDARREARREQQDKASRDTPGTVAPRGMEGGSGDGRNGTGGHRHEPATFGPKRSSRHARQPGLWVTVPGPRALPRRPGTVPDSSPNPARRTRSVDGGGALFAGSCIRHKTFHRPAR